MKQNNPLGAAIGLRALFEQDIPKTWSDYYDGGKRMTAYEMTRLIQEQTGMKFKGAGVVCQSVCPELFAEYWDKLAEAAQHG